MKHCDRCCPLEKQSRKPRSLCKYHDDIFKFTHFGTLGKIVNIKNYPMASETIPMVEADAHSGQGYNNEL